CPNFVIPSAVEESLSFDRYLGTIPTKSRTAFSSGIENALPSSLRNQNALDEPPSKLSARWILKSPSGTARILARSAKVASEQNPKAARSPEPIAAKERRAARIPSKLRTDFARSTRNGPPSIAAFGFRRTENSATRKIWTALSQASTPLINRPRLNREVTFPSMMRRPSGAKFG